jgi:hypothetical protein
VTHTPQVTDQPHINPAQGDVPENAAAPAKTSPRKSFLRSVVRWLVLGAARNIDRKQSARLAAILPLPLKREPGLMNRYSGPIQERIRQMGL